MESPDYNKHFKLNIFGTCTWSPSCLQWWRHQMDTFSALLTLCEGNPPVTGGFHTQRPVTRSFEVFFDLRLNKRLSKQSRRRWFETSHSLWRHYNGAGHKVRHISWKFLCPSIITKNVPYISNNFSKWPQKSQLSLAPSMSMVVLKVLPHCGVVTARGDIVLGPH